MAWRASFALRWLRHLASLEAAERDGVSAYWSAAGGYRAGEPHRPPPPPRVDPAAVYGEYGGA